MENKVHPLVFLNISDHFQRTRDAHGVLLGTTGKSNEMFTTFEVPFADGRLDMEFLAEKLEHMKQIYPDYEMIGVYTCGSLDFFPQVRAFNDVALCLDMGDTITLYNSSLHVIPFQIESLDEERIAVEELQAQNDRQVESLLIKQRNALDALIAALERCVQTTEYTKLRALRGLVASRSLGHADLHKEAAIEAEDVQLQMQLAYITKAAAHLERVSASYTQPEQRKQKMRA